MQRSPIETRAFAAAAVALALLVPLPAATAADAPTLNLSLKGHKFEPAELQAPAGKAFVIVLKNLDPTPAEFESHALRVEKVVTAGGSITIRMRPQSAGRYRFFDDFHPDAQGHLVVK